MPVTPPIFDLPRAWRPVAESFDAAQHNSRAFAECADSVLHELAAMQSEVLAKAREVELLAEQLAHREQQLAEQQTSHASLLSRFDQQGAHLETALERIHELRSELALRASETPHQDVEGTVAAIAAARAAWEKDHAEIIERLGALAMMQQTGSGDSEGAQAFCHELLEMQKLIGSSQAQTQAAFKVELAELGSQLASLAASFVPPTSPAESIEELQTALAELRRQIAESQSHSAEALHQSMATLQERLERLVDAQAPVADSSPHFAALLERLEETKQLVQEVRSDSQKQAELQVQRGDSSSEEEFLAMLHKEVEALRQQSTEARHEAESAREQASREESERALVENELDRLRTQAAQWRQELEEEATRHQEEERLWREELHDLRQLVHQVATNMVKPGELAEPLVTASRPAVAEQEAPREKDVPEGDAVANSLMAQFAKLQKDSARRRTRGNS